jgi:hypothetical protein
VIAPGFPVLDAHKEKFLEAHPLPQCLAWAWQTQSGLNDKLPVSNQILWNSQAEPKMIPHTQSDKTIGCCTKIVPESNIFMPLGLALSEKQIPRFIGNASS